MIEAKTSNIDKYKAMHSLCQDVKEEEKYFKVFIKIFNKWLDEKAQELTKYWMKRYNVDSKLAYLYEDIVSEARVKGYVAFEKFEYRIRGRKFQDINDYKAYKKRFVLTPKRTLIENYITLNMKNYIVAAIKKELNYLNFCNGIKKAKKDKSDNTLVQDVITTAKIVKKDIAKKIVKVVKIAKQFGVKSINGLKKFFSVTEIKQIGVFLKVRYYNTC